MAEKEFNTKAADAFSSLSVKNVVHTDFTNDQVVLKDGSVLTTKEFEQCFVPKPAGL